MAPGTVSNGRRCAGAGDFPATCVCECPTAGDCWNGAACVPDLGPGGHRRALRQTGQRQRDHGSLMVPAPSPVAARGDGEGDSGGAVVHLLEAVTMRSRTLPPWLFLVAMLVAHVGCPTTASGLNGAALRTCESALRDRVGAKYPGSGRVEVRQESVRQKQTGKDRLVLSGGGQVGTRNGGWRRLTFECGYDTRTNAVASIRYDVAAASSTSGGAPLTPAYVCKKAVARRIHDDHPASGKIRWSVPGLREQAIGNGQTIVTGRGRIQTRYGDWRRFTFSCTYDARRNRATRANAKF
jgi:hypothetical protein